MNSRQKERTSRRKEKGEGNLKPPADKQKVDGLQVVATFLQNLLAKKGLEGLPEVLNKITTAVDKPTREGLVAEALKTIKGDQARAKVEAHGKELTDAVMANDVPKLHEVLEKVLGNKEDQSLSEEAATVAIVGWFEAPDGVAKTQRIKELRTKMVELQVENQTVVESGLDLLEKVDDMTEEQKQILLRQMERAHDLKQQEKKKDDLRKADKKLEAKLEAEKRKSWRDTESVRDRARLDAVRKVVKLAESGEIGLLDEQDLTRTLEPGILGVEGDGAVGFGELGKRLVDGLEDDEKKVVLDALTAVNRTRSKPESVHQTRASFEVGGSRTGELEAMGINTGLSVEEYQRLKELYDLRLNQLNRYDEIPNLTPDEINLQMPDLYSQDRRKDITSDELRSYLYTDEHGYIRINEEMIATEDQQKRFKELYFDMAVQAARKMFNGKVDSRGMDVYYDPSAKEYIAIKSIQGIFELDDSMLDAVRLKSTMLYLGEAMEGGYHDPKQMLEILASLEKPGKFFLKTLQRAEGLYYTDEDGQKQQLCRLNTYDLQKMVEQTCMVDGVYPPEAGSSGSIERRRWLTMLVRENDIRKLGDVDGAFLTATIQDKIGVGAWMALNDKQRGEILREYNTMVRDVILYEAATDRIGECFENASFGMQKDADGNEIAAIFNLPQRIPEMWYKNSRAGVRFFILKYGAGNMLEFTKVMDNILPSYFLYRHETMSHLTDKSAVGKTFFNGDNTHSGKLAKLMEESIITWNLGDGDNDWLEYGVKGRKDTAMRRANEDVGKRLLSLDLTIPDNLAMVNAIDYREFTKLTGIVIGGRTGVERWQNFAKGYSDGYYNMVASPAKGWADWVGKFKSEKSWGMYELFMGWIANPQNSEAMSKVWGAISSYTKPDALWAKYDKFMREKGAPVSDIGYYKTVKRDANSLTMWQKDEGHRDTALPVPQMKTVLGISKHTSQHGWKNQIEAETKFETPDIDMLMEANHRDMARQGWATSDEPYSHRLKNKFKEILAPHRNLYVDVIADVLVVPVLVRILKKITGFHDNAQFWHWLLIEPLPDAIQNIFEIFGVKFKLK